MNVTELDNVVVRFSGDSGDGMQLTGTLFSNLSAILGNEISTFPDFPAEIRAPQGTLGGVSGFQVHLGSSKVYTPGDIADVLVAMNPAALKVNAKGVKKTGIVVIDTDSFGEKDLGKAGYKTDNPFEELGFSEVTQIIPVPLTTLTKASLADFGMDPDLDPCSYDSGNTHRVLHGFDGKQRKSKGEEVLPYDIYPAMGSSSLYNDNVLQHHDCSRRCDH